MRKVAIVAGVAIAMAVLPATVALADSNNEANTESHCTDVGGEFTEGGSGNRPPNECAWTDVDVDEQEFEDVVTKEVGTPSGKGKAWKASGTKTTTTTTENTVIGPPVKTLDSEVIDVLEESDVTECFLPNGKQKKNTDGDHCQL